LEMKNKLAG